MPQVAIIFVLSAVALLAQSSHVEGRVTNARGEAVRKASVTLQKIGLARGEAPVNYSAASEPNGGFSFGDVPPGRYALNVEKPGFVRTAFGATARNLAGTPLILNEGQSITALVVRMIEQGVITGTVLDRDGDPVQGAQVIALERVFIRGRRQLALIASTTSDDQGDYRLAGLAPGQYAVAADRRTLGFTNSREAFALTYFPRTTDPAGAVSIDVASGNEQGGIDLRLETTEVSAIRGRAIDTTTGRAPASANISALSAESASGPLGFVSQRTAQTVRPGTGQFEIRGLPHGSYILRGTGQSEAGAQLVARADLRVAGDYDQAILEFGPGIAIEGIIKWTGPDARSDAPVSLAVNFAEAEGVSPGIPVALVQPDGSFLMRGLPAARYFLTVQGLPDDVYVKSMRLGTADVTHTSADLSRAPEGVLEITLSTGAGSIAGVIVDDQNQPLGGAAVTLWPKNPEGGSALQGIRTATTDQTGAFRFGGLVPGEYYTAAWAEPEPGLTSARDFLTQFTSDAALLDVTEGMGLSVPLKRISADRMAEASAKLP